MRACLAIALNTYRELIRSKVLYLALFFALLLIALSVFLATVSIGDRIKVIKDFALFAVSLIGIGFSVVSGSLLLSKELQRKTIYNILSKPIARWEFMLGKYLGMLGTSAILIVLMNLAVLLFIWILDNSFDALLLHAALFMLFELAIVTALVMLFSAIVVTPLLVGLFSFGLFLAGRSVSYINQLAELSSIESTKTLLGIIAKLVPNLEHVSIINSVVYGKAVSVEQLLYAGLYSASYSSACLVLASILFMRRDFN
jgi:ABC-type transport system involved in multi-copper enzyme maturation permease subunit